MENSSNNSQSQVKLKEMLDTEALQSLMDDFYLITNFGIRILDIEGNILVGTGWQDVCSKFHRVNPLTKQNCIESDTFLCQNIKMGEIVEYKCKNHLRDIVTPLFVNNQHAGNIFLGQFMYEDEIPDYEVFLNQAEQYGFNKEEYLSAISLVPRWNRSKVKHVISFYSKLAQLISNLLTNKTIS